MSSIAQSLKKCFGAEETREIVAAYGSVYSDVHDESNDVAIDTTVAINLSDDDVDVCDEASASGSPRPHVYVYQPQVDARKCTSLAELYAGEMSRRMRTLMDQMIKEGKIWEEEEKTTTVPSKKAGNKKTKKTKSVLRQDSILVCPKKAGVELLYYCY